MNYLLSAVALIAGIIAFIFVGKKTISYMFRISFGLVKTALSILAFVMAVGLIIALLSKI